MDEKSVADLIQRDLDGTLSPEEKLRLEREIATNPQIRRMHTELRAVKDALSQIADVNPPPTLKPSILREIQRRRAPVRTPQSILARLLEPFRLKPAIRYAVAVAGGIMVGIIGFAVLSTLPSSSSLDNNDIIGTLSLGGSLKEVTPGPQLDIAGEGIQGAVRTESTKDFRVIHCELTADHPSEVTITFDPSKSSVVAAKNDLTRGTSILARDGEVRLAGDRGIRSTVLFSAPAGGVVSLHVSVTWGGAAVVERDLVLGTGSPG